MLAGQVPLSAILTVFTLAASVVFCLRAEDIGRRFRVMDHPDNKRKYHTRATPLVGGIAILVPLAIWLVAAIAAGGVMAPTLGVALLVVGTGVGLVGFVDDQNSISPLSRILFLVVFLMAAFALEPAFISPVLYWGSFNPTPIPFWGFCALMAAATIGVVNAVNMADGQNGIVASIFVIWSFCLVLIGDATLKVLAETICGASVVVLLFNLRGKLFLGDCGTYGVTFVLGLATMFAHAQGRVSIETIASWLFIPVADCLRLLISRPLRGRSPMDADRDHFHHRLQDEFGERYVFVAYIGVLTLSSLAATLAPHLALVCIIVLTAFYFSFAFLAGPSAARDEAESDESGDPANVIALAPHESAKHSRSRHK